MGQIKNIKLHIVTDIKCLNIKKKMANLLRIASRSRALPMLMRRSLASSGQPLCSAEVAAAPSAELDAKASGPWTALSLEDKKALYARQYEMSLIEEDDARHADPATPLMLMVVAVGCALGYFQYWIYSRVGRRPNGRTMTPEWVAAGKERYAKHIPNPIIKQG